MKKISTTAIGKAIDLSSKEIFSWLVERGLIEKENELWVLTKSGVTEGGEYKSSDKFGKYIVWPDTLAKEISNQINNKVAGKLITSTIVGKHFDISANKVNFIFSELGWLKKGIKGWLITDQGKKLGGEQSEDWKSGVPYVKWPEVILKTKTLSETIGQVKGDELPKNTESRIEKDEKGFREKFEAKHRSTDGHFVRSKAEMLIDNWLYMAEIVHAYERKLPIEEDVYSDFYIPTGKVYIEYWGYENEEKYLARKKEKIDIYKKYEFNLIELQDADVKNLDDVLPRQLLKYGVQAY